MSVSGFAQEVILAYGEVHKDARTPAVYMVNTEYVYGFQFTIDNIEGLAGAGGGSAQVSGFTVSANYRQARQNF